MMARPPVLVESVPVLDARRVGAVGSRRLKADASAIPRRNDGYPPVGHEVPAEDVALVNGIFNLNPARREIFSELARVVRTGGRVFAAELILRGPLPAEVRSSEADWFA